MVLRVQIPLLSFKQYLLTFVHECGFKCGWCGFNPDYPHWSYIDKAGSVACIWFMWIYWFLRVWLECGLCGFFNFNNTLCGLFVAFVDFYTLLPFKSTCDMVLMRLHVDSISVSISKSKSNHIETKEKHMLPNMILLLQQ